MVAPGELLRSDALVLSGRRAVRMVAERIEQGIKSLRASSGGGKIASA